MSTLTDRLSTAAVTAQVLLFQSEHNLPCFDDLHVTTSNGIVSLAFTTAEDLAAWNEAMGGDAIRSQAYNRDPEPKTLHNGSADRWGWHVSLSALVPVSSAVEPLPVETVAALLALAEPADVLAEDVPELTEVTPSTVAEQVTA